MVLVYLVSTTEPCHTQAGVGFPRVLHRLTASMNGEGIIALRVQSIAPSATMPFDVGRESWGPKPMVQAVQQKVDHRCRVLTAYPTALRGRLPKPSPGMRSQATSSAIETGSTVSRSRADYEPWASATNPFNWTPNRPRECASRERRRRHRGAPGAAGRSSRPGKGGDAFDIIIYNGSISRLVRSRCRCRPEQVASRRPPRVAGACWRARVTPSLPSLTSSPRANVGQ